MRSGIGEEKAWWELKQRLEKCHSLSLATVPDWAWSCHMYSRYPINYFSNSVHIFKSNMHIMGQRQEVKERGVGGYGHFDTEEMYLVWLHLYTQIHTALLTRGLSHLHWWAQLKRPKSFKLHSGRQRPINDLFLKLVTKMLLVKKYLVRQFVYYLHKIPLLLNSSGSDNLMIKSTKQATVSTSMAWSVSGPIPWGME